MHTVGELMSGEVVTVAGGDLVGDVRRQMQDHDIHALPVLDGDGSLAGIVTSSDLLTESPPSQRVASIMTSPVVTVAPSTEVALAAEVMRERHIHHLAVVDSGGGLVGIASSWDLLDDLVATVRTLTVTGVERPPVDEGDQLVEQPVEGEGSGRRGEVLEVHGPAGHPPWVVQWENGDGKPSELRVVRRDDFVLDGCER